MKCKDCIFTVMDSGKQVGCRIGFIGRLKELNIKVGYDGRYFFADGVSCRYRRDYDWLISCCKRQVFDENSLKYVLILNCSKADSLDEIKNYFCDVLSDVYMLDAYNAPIMIRVVISGPKFDITDVGTLYNKLRGKIYNNMFDVCYKIDSKKGFMEFAHTFCSKYRYVKILDFGDKFDIINSDMDKIRVELRKLLYMPAIVLPQNIINIHAYDFVKRAMTKPKHEDIIEFMKQKGMAYEFKN